MGKTFKALGKKLNQLKNWLLRLLLLGFQVSLFFVIIYRIVPVFITPLPIVRLVDQAFGEDPFRLKKDWVKIENIHTKPKRNPV
jgi:monofunctional biosynthetic peptidoglycan transglycosylase